MATSGFRNHDDSSSGGRGHAKRSSEQPHPQQTARLVPDPRGAVREPATASVQGQPRLHQPHRRYWRQSEDLQVEEKEEGEDSFEQAEEAEEAGEAEAEEEVRRREQHAQAPGASLEGRVEAADDNEEESDEDDGGEGEDEGGEDEDEDDGNVSGGALQGGRRRPALWRMTMSTSAGTRVVGVSWVPARNKWLAYKLEGGNRKQKYLGYHLTQQAAGSGVHSSAFQLNLSRFCHKQQPKFPQTLAKYPRNNH